MKKTSILEDLFESKMILIDTDKGWKLHSGIQSPIYIQLRNLVSYPYILKKIAVEFEKKLNMLFDKNQKEQDNLNLLGIAMTGIPIAVSLSLETGIPCLMTRKIEKASSLEDANELVKKYGDHHLVEGRFYKNMRIVLIDDIMTSFKSKIAAIEMLEYAMEQKGFAKAFSIPYAFVLIDRQQMNIKELEEKYKIRIISLFKMKEDILPFLKTKISPNDYEKLEDYFNQNFFT